MEGEARGTMSIEEFLKKDEQRLAPFSYSRIGR